MTQIIYERDLPKVEEWLEAGKLLYLFPTEESYQSSMFSKYDKEENQLIMWDFEFDIKKTERFDSASEAIQGLQTLLGAKRNKDWGTEMIYIVFYDYEIDFVEVNDYSISRPYNGSLTAAYEALQASHKEYDEVYSPSHYYIGDLEAIDVIRNSLTREELIGYYKGNILKYRLRAGEKGDPTQDLEKAQVYNGWLDKLLENGND